MGILLFLHFDLCRCEETDMLLLSYCHSRLNFCLVSYESCEWSVLLNWMEMPKISNYHLIKTLCNAVEFCMLNGIKRISKLASGRKNPDRETCFAYTMSQFCMCVSCCQSNLLASRWLPMHVWITWPSLLPRHQGDAKDGTVKIIEQESAEQIKNWNFFKILITRSYSNLSSFSCRVKMPLSKCLSTLEGIKLNGVVLTVLDCRCSYAIHKFLENHL